MTSLLEKIVSKIAPHHCIVCSNEDNIVCEACAADLFGLVDSACFLCQAPTADFAVCRSCKSKTQLERVWFTADYDGAVAKAIKLLKFERAAAAAKPLARAMVDVLPYLPEDMIIVPVPTAARRIRQRGYDQTTLLAEALSQETGLNCKQLLLRKAQNRQLGASRQTRAAQSAHAFEALEDCTDQAILLVDDVVTTGATLNAAAQAVRAAGAKSVTAVVVARTV